MYLIMGNGQKWLMIYNYTFSIDTLKKLLDNYDESYVSYCLVPILLNIAINHPKLSVDDRIYILKSLFTCFILYQRTF